MSFKEIPLIGNEHSEETRNIINLMVQVINNRGIEILSDSAFLTWLEENGVKHRGEWDNAKEYDRFSVVFHEGNSYTSTKQVPAGIDILNDEFWVATGNYTTLSKETETYNIPSDYPDIQTAIDNLSKSHAGQGVKFIINIESGHILKSGFNVKDGYYGQFYITSIDPVVMLDPNFKGDLFVGNSAVMPHLNTIVDMQGAGLDGYHVNTGSTGYIEQGCGIKNAGLRCAYVNMSSRLNGLRGIYTGAGETGVWVSRSSMADLEESDFSGATNEGLMSRRASNVHAQYSKFHDCGQAIVGSRGKVNAVGVSIERTTQKGKASVVAEQGATVIVSSGATPTHLRDLAGHGILTVSGGTVIATLIDIDTCGGVGMRCSTGQIMASESSISNAGEKGIEIFNGGKVDFYKGKLLNSGTGGVDIRRTGSFNGAQSEITFNGGAGILSYYSSGLELEQSIIQNNAGEGVYLLEGSTANLKNATIKDNRNGFDIRIATGSQAFANSTVTTSTEILNDTNMTVANSIDENKGIIWN